MVTSRKEIFNAEEQGFYHCISRCVRSAFLFGTDKFSGSCFDHRKSWVEARLAHLSKIFAIEICAYAIMSNHIHIALSNRPDLANAWRPEEVALRWRRLFPRRYVDGVAAEPNSFEISEITSDSDRVELLRERLGNISWFNRCLNENIARRANAEDKCKGRFWEGRFKTQKLQDYGALIACMAYIDLNPIRAGAALNPEESDFTSIQERIRHLNNKIEISPEPKPLLQTLEDITGNNLSCEDYLSLVDETGRILRDGKGAISDELLTILVRINIKPNNWVSTTKSFKKSFRRIVGSLENIRAAARAVNKNWFQGLRSAQNAFM